jgi:hypothetical protein
MVVPQDARRRQGTRGAGTTACPMSARASKRVFKRGPRRGSCLAAWGHAAPLPIGFPAFDCAGTPGALNQLEPDAQRPAGRAYKPPKLPYPMPQKQPNFAERCRAMHDAAHDLKSIAEMIALEAIRMESAAQRFNERRGERRVR